MKKLKSLSASIFVAVLSLNGCGTVIPNIKAAAPVQGVPGVAAVWQNTNNDESGRFTLEEWLKFLYADHDTGKGPAICVSNDDWRRNETAIAELCAKNQCTYEQAETLARLKEFRLKIEALHMRTEGATISPK